PLLVAKGRLPRSTRQEETPGAQSPARLRVACVPRCCGPPTNRLLPPHAASHADVVPSRASSRVWPLSLALRRNPQICCPTRWPQADCKPGQHNESETRPRAAAKRRKEKSRTDFSLCLSEAPLTAG